MHGEPRGPSGRAALRGSLRTRVIGMRGFLSYHCGDSVLKDELFLIIRLQNQRVLVETLDSTGELDAAHQVNREDNFIFASVV